MLLSSSVSVGGTTSSTRHVTTVRTHRHNIDLMCPQVGHTHDQSYSQLLFNQLLPLCWSIGCSIHKAQLFLLENNAACLRPPESLNPLFLSCPPFSMVTSCLIHNVYLLRPLCIFHAVLLSHWHLFPGPPISGLIFIWILWSSWQPSFSLSKTIDVIGWYVKWLNQCSEETFITV